MSAERRLGSLERLRRKLSLLEAQATALDEAATLAPAYDDGDFISSPIKAGRSAAAAAADAVSDLRMHVESVLDAEAGGDEVLAAITHRHCAGRAVEVIRDAEDATGGPPLDAATRSAVELAASTLCTLSQRPSAHDAMLKSAAVPALISLLNPAHAVSTVAIAAAAIGNLASDAECRRAARSHGAVGALVRLLRPGSRSAAQAAAASALCLLAARDSVVQDSVRYLGGIDVLVGMLASPKASLAEVARYCLAALKHGNPRNEADILDAVRSSPELARDYHRLRDALEILRRDDDSGAGRSAVRAAEAAEERARLEAATAAEEEEEARRCRAALRALRSSVAASADALDARLAQASANAARAAARAASVGRVRPGSAASAAAAAAAAATAAAAASAAADAAAAAAGRGGGLALSPRREVAARRSPAKSRLGKHILLFSCDELCALLGEMGWDAADLRGLRRAGTTGAELLLQLAAAAASDPACSELAARLRVPPHKARRLRRLVDATALFDSVASRAAQPRLSEIELRLWLAGSGCSGAETSRVLRLLCSLVARDERAPFITYWEWAVGWGWVTHALEVYGLDWRAAL